MSAATYKSLLAQAKDAFDHGRYEVAIKLLEQMPHEDSKVQHNLAALQYVTQNTDAAEAVALLQGSGPVSEKKSGLVLMYEGHETALYNRAAIYARSGLIQESTSLLRSLLEMAKDISLTVVTHALCLFQTLTRPPSKLGGRPRAKSDEDLLQKVLSEKMNDITRESSLLSLVTAAFADSSTLHEVFKNAASEPVNQAIYLNNLGVMSLGDGKAAVASLCFAKAMDGLTPKTDFRVTYRSISYNAGLCALLRGDHAGALHLFLSVQDTMKASPLYWVRVAEAAVCHAQALQRRSKRTAYEAQQSEYANLLLKEKVYANFEFMMLPGAVTAPHPTKDHHAERANCVEAERVAVQAVQNALFLLVPQGSNFISVLEEFPQREQMVQYAVLYWVAAELLQRNYMVAAEIGQKLLGTSERRPLPATLHAALLSYVVEALIHLNDADKAMAILRKASLSSLLTGAAADHPDVAQRSRMEALFLNVAVVHVLVGNWNQAHATLESLLNKVHEAAPAEALEYTPEKDVVFACQMLSIFLELAQNNTEKAAEQLGKLTWSI